MPNYAYKALDSSGQRSSGRLPAANRLAFWRRSFGLGS